MSGSAALAAARRRRAAPQGPPAATSNANRRSPQPPMPPPSQANQVQNDSSQSTTQAQVNRMNPTQMLMNHNRMIENLNKVVESVNTQVEREMMTKQEIQSFINSAIEEAMSKNKLNDDNLEFFKTKYNKMSTQLQDIKKHIIKVQTFAMETNLQCIELKKKFFREKNESKTMDQIMKSDKHKLEVSNDTQNEQIKQISRVGNVTDMLHNEENKIL